MLTEGILTQNILLFHLYNYNICGERWNYRTAEDWLQRLELKMDLDCEDLDRILGQGDDGTVLTVMVSVT